MGKDSEMGIGCSSELPFVFEMSQAIVVILVEPSRKVGDLISIKLLAFFLWKASEVTSGRWILLLDFATGCGL